MSLSEERLLILKMLEEGKITGEEAARLMEALDGGQKQSSPSNFNKHQKKAEFHDEIHKIKDRLHEWKRDFKSNYNQKDFDRAVDEFSQKAEKLGKNLATTTFGIVDKVIDFVGSFIDTNSFKFFGNCPIVEKSFEAVATENMELSIEGVNGHISVKRHSDNKIIVKSKIRSPQTPADNAIVSEDTGNTFSLKINKTVNMSVSHEILLPAIKFGKIRLETSNGRIYVEDSLSQVFEGVTRNSHIELMGVNSEKINVSTKNARIQVSYVIGKDISINTNNSVIDIKHIKAENLSADTRNGRILVENVQNYEDSTNINLILKTSNGGIKINMDDAESRGYKVKAHTTNGGVNLLIPDMVYGNINRQGHGGSSVEAESNGYASFQNKVSIAAETVNGYIEVVK